MVKVAVRLGGNVGLLVLQIGVLPPFLHPRWFPWCLSKGTGCFILITVKKFCPVYWRVTRSFSRPSHVIVLMHSCKFLNHLLVELCVCV